MQLTCCQKVRALTLRECNWTQQEVAEEMGVTVRTIQKLEQEARRQKVGRDAAPLRIAGSGRKRSYEKKQIKAIEDLIDKELGLT